VTTIPTRSEDAEELLPSLKRRLLSGGAWALGSRLITAFAAFAANLVLARLLAPADLGAYFLAFSVVSVGSLLGLLGTEQAVVRLVAESVDTGRPGRARRVLRSAFALGGVGAVALGAGYLLLGGLLERDVFGSPALAEVTGLVAAWMVAVALQLLIAEAFRGLHDLRLASVFFSLGNGVLLTLALVVASLADARVPLRTVLLLAVGVNLVSLALAAAVLRRRVASLPVDGEPAGDAGIGAVARLAWPLLVMNLTLVALGQGYVDLWIVGAAGSEQDVAVFGAAARAVMLVVLPILILNSVVAPLIAGTHAQGRTHELERTLRLATTAAAVPTLVVWAAFVLLGAPILGLLYGDAYRDGAVVLALLSTGQLVNVLVGPCAAVLTMTGHQRTAMLITVAGGLVIVVGGLVLVGPYGIDGVAAATAAGITVTNLAYWVAARRATGIATHAGARQLRDLLRIAARVAARR
jgi:O-antigen/teichoic acid export membrane protein